MFKISLYTLHQKSERRAILYEKLFMKLDLNVENIHVDQFPQNGI